MQTLEKGGLRACIDFRDFRPGAPIVIEIERLMEVSYRTLVVLTPNYLASEWTKLETLLLQTDDPTKEKLRLIPILKTPCDIPNRLKILTYVDFTEHDDLQFAWTRLLTALERPLQPEPATHWFLAHPYGMPPNFTGRNTELQTLDDWLHNDTQHPLFVLRALGGFGKSAITWHWLTNYVDAQQWPQVVWWSFVESPPNFDRFLQETLKYLTGREQDSKASRQQLDELLNLLQKQSVLLILDSFERELRANSTSRADSQEGVADHPTSEDRDCLSALASDFLRRVASMPHLKGKVLLSTRLLPSAVEMSGGRLLIGCREEELREMLPEEAIEFFRRQGIIGGVEEIRRVCSALGYHPLSLRLASQMIVQDIDSPGDIRVAEKLDLSTIFRQQNKLYQLSIYRQKYRLQCFTEPALQLDLMLIPDGTFTMGSPPDELGRYDEEGPQHQVTVPPFLMGRYPVTQVQWRAIATRTDLKVNTDLDPDPANFKDDNRPVEQVSWHDAVEFCDRLSRLTSHTYRLPTEAEWEYACRAGTETPFHFGETITTDLANYCGEDNESQPEEYPGHYGQGPKGIYRKETTPVNHFHPLANAFGLCDLHGNVWEWCMDHWHDNYDGAPTDGSAWLTDDKEANRVIRGGSWLDQPRNCRSACRDNSDPGNRDVTYNIGFRLVCEARSP